MNFFLLGNPRSGTSLLRLMLNSHNLIGVPPESGFFQWLEKKYALWGLENTINKEQLLLFITDLLNSKKIESWNIDKEKLYNYILKSEVNSYADMINKIYIFKTDKSLIGDKNNYYIDHLDLINKHYPKTKYIHIVRDVRDVACSYLELKELNSKVQYFPKLETNIKNIALEWNSNLSKIDDFISKKQHMTIRYEDLLRTPETELTKICSLLGVSYDDNMLNYFQDKFHDEPEITMKWKMKTKTKIDTTNIGKYKLMLSLKDIQIIEENCKLNFSKYNYKSL